MAQNRLRVFYPSAPEESSDTGASGENNTHYVAVTLEEFLAPLLHAARHNKAWVHDFTEEQILVPHDLYEVAQCYQRLYGHEH